MRKLPFLLGKYKKGVRSNTFLECKLISDKLAGQPPCLGFILKNISART